MAAEERARALSNRQMFARIAGRYDLMNRLMSWGRDRAWRREAAQAAAPAPCALALDMATGTGDLALALAPRAGRVLGVDITPPMLALARRKAAARGLEGQVSFALADGLRLPFPEGLFDAVATAFSLRNLAQVEGGLREIHRVLKSGGHLATLELFRAPTGLRRYLQKSYLGLLIPLIGWAVAGNGAAYLYLRDSITNFYSPQDIKELMEKVGFDGVHYRLYHWGSIAVHVGVKEPIHP